MLIDDDDDETFKGAGKALFILSFLFARLFACKTLFVMLSFGL
jgi:hypothetical protein